MSSSLKFASPPTPLPQPLLLLAAPPPTRHPPEQLLPLLSDTLMPQSYACKHSQHHPHSPLTWWREIPMQLPILYSMSSSGEVTRALHGWQSTLLQNCIIRSQSQHCQSGQICGAAVCASLPLPLSHSG